MRAIVAATRLVPEPSGAVAAPPCSFIPISFPHTPGLLPWSAAANVAPELLAEVLTEHNRNVVETMIFPVNETSYSHAPKPRTWLGPCLCRRVCARPEEAATAGEAHGRSARYGPAHYVALHLA